MKKFALLILALLLTSCASKLSPVVLNDSAINRSALLDPPTVTLVAGRTYAFAEGDLVGAGQLFHSHYSYMRAVIVGNK